MKYILTLFFLFSLNYLGFAQSHHTGNAKPVKLTESTIVKDSSGNLYSYEIWRKLVATGKYTLKAESPADPNSAFLLTRLSDEQFAKRMEKLPKPKESESFITGQKLPSIKARDINGKKINTKKLEGKIVVLNFWFIKCPPCVMEMPELNKIVEEYKNDSSIVFISVALDDAASLSQFLYSTKFKYAVIPDGKYFADVNKIRAYPTNVVVSPEGTVYFHSSGYSGFLTTNWIKKSIEELKAKMPTEEQTLTTR